MDLSTFSSPELKQLAEQISQEQKKREHMEIARAREDILAIARNVGVPLKDLMAEAPKAKRGPVAIQFRHPTDSTLEWTGRGRKPKWVVAWLDSGKTLSDIRIAT